MGAGASTVPIRLLLIEDDKHVRAVIRDLVTGFGYDVEVAHDGATGLTKFRAGRFQAVITDLLMPGLTGLQVAAAIREHDSAVPVLLLTGSADSPALVRARQEGLTILHKPFPIQTLRAAIEAALRAR
jgi:DNA-binding response OmpR family regulator